MKYDAQDMVYSASIEQIVEIFNDMCDQGYEIFENDPEKIFRDMSAVDAVCIVENTEYHTYHRWARWNEDGDIESCDDPVSEGWIDINEMIEWLSEDDRYENYL